MNSDSSVQSTRPGVRNCMWKIFWGVLAFIAIVYVLVFSIDCWIHFSQGRRLSQSELDRLESAIKECDSKNLTSEVMVRHCTRTKSMPLPAPWADGFHNLAKHLAKKFYAFFNSVLTFIFWMVVVFVVALFWQIKNPITIFTSNFQPQSNTGHKAREHRDYYNTSQTQNIHQQQPRSHFNNERDVRQRHTIVQLPPGSVRPFRRTSSNKLKKPTHSY